MTDGNSTRNPVRTDQGRMYTMNRLLSDQTRPWSTFLTLMILMLPISSCKPNSDTSQERAQCGLLISKSEESNYYEPGIFAEGTTRRDECRQLLQPYVSPATASLLSTGITLNQCKVWVNDSNTCTTKWQLNPCPPPCS
jgi:hypothetical protein